MTNRQETKDRQYVARLSHFRSLLRRQFGFLAFAPLVLTSSLRGCDDMRPASITCQDIILHIEPGTCVEFSNSCNQSGAWAGPPAYDGFRLEPTEEIEASFAATGVPFSVNTTRSGYETTRSICVRADSPLFPSLEIDYVYGLGVQYGVASLLLSVTRPLTVEVSASPTNPTLGESSQLVATARGGIRPYFYSWVPTTSLNDTDIAAPIATPTETTLYRVRVTDSGGQETIGEVTISVGTELAVTAYPQEIGIGDVAVLLAEARGGNPPHTYAWTPVETLDDPYVSHPTAAPTTTTTYHVTVFDKDDDTVGSGSVTVKVRLEVAVTAQSQNILAGQSTALLAAVRGGTEPYTYTWTPTDTLDDPQRKDPIAAPTMTTTYHVLARDAVGDATAGEVTVQVIDDVPPPTASFVMGIACCPSITLDASASTGNIVTYTWDLGWTSANPDRISASPTTSFPINEFDRGPITLTVTAADGQTATATRNF